MVKLVQMLCAQRHCLLASAYEEGNGTFVEACEQLEAIVRDTPMNRWCAICGSRDIRFEEGTMAFKTLAEAIPTLMANEQACIESRISLDAAGKTVDRDTFNLPKVLQATRKAWK